MTVVVSAGTTGPDPFEHEVVHFGCEFCSDDYQTVFGTFYAYLKAERPEAAVQGYLERAGFASADQLAARGEYYRPAADVWRAFARTLLRHDAEHGRPVSGREPSSAERAKWAEKGLGAGAEALPSVLARTRIACFNAALEAPFLGSSMRAAGFPLDFESSPMTSSLCGLLLDYTTGLRYLGFHREARFEFEQTLAFFGVACKRPTDPLERAGSVRRAYTNHFTSLKAIYESAAKWEGSRGHGRRRAR